MLSTSFQTLPSDILQQILEYVGTIKYRNGKYMNQLSKNDRRYDLLQSIPKSVALFNNDMFFCFIIHFTPSRIENAHGNVTLPLESATNVADSNRHRCNNRRHTLVIKNLNKFNQVNDINYNFWSSDPDATKRTRSYQVYTRY